MTVDVPFGYAIVPRYDEMCTCDSKKCIFFNEDYCADCLPSERADKQPVYFEMIKLPDGFWETMEA